MDAPETVTRRIGSRATRPGLGPYGLRYDKSYALLIGINYKANRNHNIPRLFNAVADAEKLAGLLPAYGFTEIELLTEEEASKAAIERQLDRLTNAKIIGQEDRVLIFYAGHGEFREVNVGNNQTERRGFLIPYDDDGSWPGRVPMQLLRDTWEASPAKHVLCLVDACYSGLAAGPRGGQIDGDGYDSGVTTYRARHVIAASTADEPIDDLFYDATGAASQHSYLTHFLTQVLENEGIPGRDTITADSLYDYLRESVFNASKERQRLTWGNFGDPRGVFVLSKPGITLPASVNLGLRSDDPGKILGALGDLRRLFDRNNPEFANRKPGDEEVETLRSEAARLLIGLLEAENDELPLENVAVMLKTLLAPSLPLQEQVAPELLALLKDGKPQRVQHVGALLVDIADTQPTTWQQAVDETIRGVLESALGAADPPLLFAAARALARFFPEAALPWMRYLLTDPQSRSELQVLAIQHMGRYGDSLDIRLIKQAIEQRPLSETGRGAGLASLRALLERIGSNLDTLTQTAVYDLVARTARFDTNPTARRQATELLAGLQGPQQLNTLGSALADPHPELRRRAAELVTALAEGSESQAVALLPLISTLAEGLDREPAPEVRGAMVVAIGAVSRGRQGGNPALAPVGEPAGPPPGDLAALGRALLRDGSLTVRQAAARSLAVSSDPRAIEPIVEYVQQGQQILQIVEALERESSPLTERLRELVPPIFPGLIEAFLQLNATALAAPGYENERAEALESLLIGARSYGDSAFLPLLRTQLDHPPDELVIRVEEDAASQQSGLYLRAIEALGRLVRSLALPLAQETMRHGLGDVQRRWPALVVLATTFRTLGGPESVEALFTLLGARVREVRQASAEALQLLLPTQELTHALRQRLTNHLKAEQEPKVHEALKLIVDSLEI